MPDFMRVQRACGHGQDGHATRDSSSFDIQQGKNARPSCVEFRIGHYRVSQSSFPRVQRVLRKLTKITKQKTTTSIFPLAVTSTRIDLGLFLAERLPCPSLGNGRNSF